MTDKDFLAPIARHIWETKYRYRNGKAVHDRDIGATWRRIARALAAPERQDRAGWERRFYDILKGFRFLPAGRILAGAGTGRNVTLFNCFVMGVVEDSVTSIFDGLKEGAVTMQQGGGVGYDFSALRPRGARAKGVGAIASGPVSFMHIWDAACTTLLSTGARRGAMMATLRCDHPDIEEFITAKQEPGRLRNFNLSVLVTDAFMEALQTDRPWPLVFPAENLDPSASGETVIRSWSGTDGPVPCRVVVRVSARGLWNKLMRATYDHAEPGVLFIDRINRFNNLWYRERISATNPCGEVPLPPYGACNLGSLNLTQFVRRPFARDASFDRQRLCAVAETAVRLLDNVIDVSRYPLEAQRRQAQGTRRIGLGITGLADALLMLGLRYGSEESLAFAGNVMRDVCHAAYRTSIRLAQEKGSFPYLDREKFLDGPFVRGLPEDIRLGIERHGIRNSHLLAIAPTGSISLLANNVSSGLEPIFSLEYCRRVLNDDGTTTEFSLRDYAWELWRRTHGQSDTPPPAFVSTYELPPEAHLDMQAALQRYVDNSVSKTVHVPRDYPFEDFERLYQTAHRKGVKGCTTFRPNPITGSVLKGADESPEAPHCCVLEREAD